MWRTKLQGFSKEEALIMLKIGGTHTFAKRDKINFIYFQEVKCLLIRSNIIIISESIIFAIIILIISMKLISLIIIITIITILLLIILIIHQILFFW